MANINPPTNLNASCIPPDPLDLDEIDKKLFPYSVGILTGAIMVAIIGLVGRKL